MGEEQAEESEPARSHPRPGSTPQPPDVLVLGGGGPVGLAWELGWLEEAADLLGASVPVIGTSAGAMAGALLLLGPARRQAIASALRHAAQQALANPPGTGPSTAIARGVHPELLQAVAAAYRGRPEEIRALGQLMSAHPDDGAHVEQLRQMLGEDWPAGDLTVVARNVSDGERTLFSGRVPLHLAVAASSAAPGRTGPVTVGGHQYIDGGIGSVLNSDLARGAGTVWLLAPAGLGSFTPEAVPSRMREEVAALRQLGTHVEVFTPAADFSDFSAFRDVARAMDDGRQVAQTWLCAA